MQKSVTCYKCSGTQFSIEVSSNIHGSVLYISKMLTCTACGNKQLLSKEPIDRQLPDKMYPFDRSLQPQSMGNQKCLFDGLPPGVYGIACPCPKCRTYC